MSLSTGQLETLKLFFASQPVKKAYVFGSFAKNTANKESDIDILFELDYSEYIGLKFIRIKNELENILHRNVDLVSSNGLSKYIKPFVDSEKLLLYDG